MNKVYICFAIQRGAILDIFLQDEVVAVFSSREEAKKFVKSNLSRGAYYQEHEVLEKC